MTDLPPIVRTITDLRSQVAGWRTHGERAALVPTMGALHEGHLSLIDVAQRAAERTVVSIFVNPTQFAPQEDFASYPRDEESDLAKLAARKTDLVYMPSPGEMYPEGFATSVRVSGLTEQMCGMSRPHFFGGVATVVAKLLIQAQADFAVFGEKDYQQLLVIRRMARDLDIPTQILSAPIVREPDGLAMSSRNHYLTPDQRVTAARFSAVLRDTATLIASGADTRMSLEDARSRLVTEGFDRVDYLEVRDESALQPVAGIVTEPARIFGSVYLGKTRLIDNIPVEPVRTA